VLGNWTILYPS